MNPTGPKTTAEFIKHIFFSQTETYDSCGDNGNDSEAMEEEKQFFAPDEPAGNITVDLAPNSITNAKRQLLTLAEWRNVIEDGTPEIRRPEHLFVAGRVLLIYSPWNEFEKKCSSHDEHQVAEQQPVEGDDIGKTTVPVACRLLRCVETDGTSPALRTIEADSPCLFTDHVTSSYFEALGMHYHFE